MRIGATILSLMLLVGFSLAAQSAGGVSRPLLSTPGSDVSDGCPSNSDLAGPAPTGPTEANLLNLAWAESTAAPSPGRYWCPGTGVYRDTIWFMGGRMSAQVSTRSMTAYDITNDAWITDDLPTLTTPRRTGGGGLIGHKMYVAGGKDSSSTILSSCEEFDLDTRTSTSKASMPIAYWAVASAVAGDKLYIIGNESALGTTFEYNPAVDSWTTKANLSVGRGWACAAGSNGLVYVMGGSDASSTALSDCWCFDPTANSWTQKASMPGPRIYSAAVAHGDSVIYVIGGSSDGAAFADKLVYSYHIAANTWSTVTSKPTASGWTMVNVAGGVIFDAYGSDCVTPTYLMNLNVASLAPTGIQAIDLRCPKAVCSINPSVVRDFARISYSAARTAGAHLGIYDATGKLVRTLVDGEVEPGNRSVIWNRTDNNGKRVADGIYFYHLVVDGAAVSGKATVLE